MTVFGPLIGLPNVENAVIATITTWLPTYLFKIEDINNLKRGFIPKPPTPESIVGGLDWLDFQQDTCPQITVICQPTGLPEMSGSAGYGQHFEVQIGATIISETETEARLFAGYYGAAILGTIVHRGDLGGFATRTTLTGYPRTQFLDPDTRRLVLSITTFDVFVADVVDERFGPAIPAPDRAPDAPYGDRPTVQSEHVSVTAVPIQQ